MEKLHSFVSHKVYGNQEEECRPVRKTIKKIAVDAKSTPYANKAKVKNILVFSFLVSKYLSSLSSKELRLCWISITILQGLNSLLSVNYSRNKFLYVLK